MPTPFRSSAHRVVRVCVCVCVCVLPCISLVEPKQVSRGLNIKDRRGRRQISIQAWGVGWKALLMRPCRKELLLHWRRCPASDPAIAPNLNVSSILEGNLVLLSSPSPSSTQAGRRQDTFSPQNMQNGGCHEHWDPHVT